MNRPQTNPKIFLSKAVSPVLKPSNSTFKLVSSSILKSPSNLTPSSLIQSRSRIKREKSKSNIIYSDWEIHEAVKQPREKSSDKIVSQLRRNMKNPHIYVSPDGDSEGEKHIQDHLMRAFETIFDDLA
jgi:hypothetical protein